MIRSALLTVVNELNNYLSLRIGLDEKKVFLSNLVDQGGAIAIKDENIIIASLVQIQEEKLAKQKYAKGGVLSRSNPPVHLNLFVLFSASFNNKLNSEALEFISLVIAFFQGKNYFDSNNTPGLDKNIDKLIFEIHNLTFHEQSNMWSILGAKYMPSILYKIRMLSIEDGSIKIQIPGIVGKDSDIKNM